MSNHAIQDAENDFVKAEPVIAAHAGAAILGYIGTLLVTHGVITGDQASALTQQVLPAVVAGLVMLLGIAVRRVVSPAAAFAQRVEEEVQNRLSQAAVTQPGNAVAATTQPQPINSAHSPGDDPIQIGPEDYLPVPAPASDLAPTEPPAAAINVESTAPAPVV